MADRTVSTIDHARVQSWAVSHGAGPAVVEGAVDGDGRPVIRFAFRDDEAGLRRVDWAEFFQIFDGGRLALEYVEGSPHREHRLVSRAEAADDAP